MTRVMKLRCETRVRTPGAAKALLALCAAGLLLAVPAAARANPCELTSQTLASSRSGDGLGGTGLSGETDSGMGGTGLGGDQDSGMGGTGVLGTITGFGSICVNGLEIELEEGAAVERDEAITSADSLALGETVLVETLRAEDGGEGQGGAHLRAERVTVLERLRGPIAELDLATSTASVLGIRVALESAVLIDSAGQPLAPSDLREGDRVVVQGHGEGHQVLATRVRLISGPELAARGPAASAEPREARVAGAISRGPDGAFRVGGVEVEARDASAHRGDDSPQIARGRWNPQRGVLEDADLRPAPGFAADRRGRVSIEGIVDQRLGSGRLAVGGYEVLVRGVPELASVRAHERVIVRGAVRGRVLRAERAWIAPRPLSPPRSPRPSPGGAVHAPGTRVGGAAGDANANPPSGAPIGTDFRPPKSGSAQGAGQPPAVERPAGAGDPTKAVDRPDLRPAPSERPGSPKANERPRPAVIDRPIRPDRPERPERPVTPTDVRSIQKIDRP